MDLVPILHSRYATKAYDAQRSIEPAVIEQIKAMLRYAPSSTCLLYTSPSPRDS